MRVEPSGDAWKQREKRLDPAIVQYLDLEYAARQCHRSCMSRQRIADDRVPSTVQQQLIAALGGKPQLLGRQLGQRLESTASPMGQSSHGDMVVLALRRASEKTSVRGGSDDREGRRGLVGSLGGNLVQHRPDRLGRDSGVSLWLAVHGRDQPAAVPLCNRPAKCDEPFAAGANRLRAPSSETIL